MRKNNQKVIVRLTREEARLARDAIIGFRNRIIKEGGPVEDLDELLKKLS